MTFELDETLTSAVHAAADWRGMSVVDYLREVVTTASNMDGELASFVQEGIDAADRGDTVSQEEMEAWFEARYRAAAAE